jgi:hypothetical protein
MVTRRDMELLAIVLSGRLEACADKVQAIQKAIAK